MQRNTSPLLDDLRRDAADLPFAACAQHTRGSGIGTCLPKHTHQQWLQFLRLIKRQTPHDKQIHLIVDNYATHKHAEVKRWLQRNKRFHVHFTPTSASWLNMVERFFRDLTNKRIRRGVFRSVKELTTAIEDHIAQYNQ